MSRKRAARPAPTAARGRVRNYGRVKPQGPSVFIHHPWLSEAGVPLTPDTMLQVSAVYGCCRLIVDALASAPVRVYGMQGAGRREVLHDDKVSDLLNYGAPVQLAPDAPTSQAVEEALFWSALIFGDGYAEIQVDNAGKPFALWPLEPGRVTPTREDGRYFYRVRGDDGKFVDLDPMRTFHLRGPSLYGWVGDSAMFRASKAIGIAQASQVFAAAYFANGTVLSGLLRYPGTLTKKQRDDFGESWRSNYSTPGKAQKTPILDQGFEYVPLNHDSQKAQLVESRRFQVQEIARFFGVPTTLLSDNEAWTNLSELYLGFYRGALKVWAERFDAEATRKLFPNRTPWREVQHDLTQLVMGSFKDQVAALREAVNGGLKTRNEARAILGDNTIGSDGDVLLTDSTVKPLAAVIADANPTIAALKAMPEVFAYHLEQGLLTKNEVRTRLGLPPMSGGDVLTEPIQKKVDEAQAQEEAVPTAPDAEEEEDEEAPGGDGADNRSEMRRGAGTIAQVAVALDRFGRALFGRRKAMQQAAPEKAEANVAEYRAKLEPALVAECVSLLGDNSPEMSMRVKTIADAVAQGEPSHLAAERLCT